MTVSNPPIFGPDVSRHQGGNINWVTVAAQAGVEFAFIKATQVTVLQGGIPKYIADGVDWVPWFRGQWAAIWPNVRNSEGGGPGLTGAAPYHYASSLGSGSLQADFYLDTCASANIDFAKPGMLRPVVDVEEGGFPGPGTAYAKRELIIDRVKTWADRVYERCGQDSIVYGRRLLLDAKITKASLGSHIKWLWLPRYTSDQIATHADAKTLGFEDWLWWQYTDGQLVWPRPSGWPYRLAGIDPDPSDDPVDISVFNGGMAELRAFARWTGTQEEDDVTPEQAWKLDRDHAFNEGVLHGMGLAVTGFDGKPVQVMADNKHPYWKAGDALGRLAKTAPTGMSESQPIGESGAEL